MKKLWIIGDNFVAETFRPCFLKQHKNFFIRENFDISVFCGSKYCDKNQNTLSRLQITMAKAINDSVVLPEFIVVVIDKDLIEFLKYENSGVSTMYGEWLEWLLKSFNDMIELRKQQLPTKCKPFEGTQTYWLHLPQHKNFESNSYTARSKFNLCLESIVKLYSNMRTIKLKYNWFCNDNISVMHNRYTAEGKINFWTALDSTLRFNIQKKREFMAKELVKSAISEKKTPNKACNPEEITSFFGKKRKNKFYWSKDTVDEDKPRKVINENRFNRFILPKPPPNYRN